MLTTRSALTPCWSISQQSLTNIRCAFACCCFGLWSSFKHLAGFLKLKSGVHVHFAAFRTAAAGFVFDGPSGRSASMSFDGSEFLESERPVDGFSWSPPGRALHADALRELVVLQDMLLQGALPELLSGGPAAGRPSRTYPAAT